jgi:hypothetical protein
MGENGPIPVCIQQMQSSQWVSQWAKNPLWGAMSDVADGRGAWCSLKLVEAAGGRVWDGQRKVAGQPGRCDCCAL